MKNSEILPQIKEINWLIFGSAISLIAGLCLVNYSDIDLWLQKFLFDQESKNWLIDSADPLKRFFFYNLPKIIFGIAIAFLLVAIFLAKKPSSAKFFRENHQRFLLILLGLVIIPLTAGNIKKFTNIYCPNQLEIYGGEKHYVKIFETYPERVSRDERGQCFPAGHCVTGFALMILFFALKSKKQRMLGLAIGVTSGWILGFYQMAKGAHFFSDTLVSMLVCFLLAALIYKIYFQLTNLTK